MIFRDGKGEGESHGGGVSGGTLLKAIEDSGLALADKLAKMLAGMPRSEVIRLLGSESVDDNMFNDSGTMEKLAAGMIAQKGKNESNFRDLGEVKETKKNIEDVDKTIDLLAGLDG